MPGSAANLDIQERPGGIELTVKVVPGASRTRIVGMWGTALKLTVSAAPEAGKANTAVTELLAETFDIRRGDVSIVAGRSKPIKRVRLLGLTSAVAQGTLARILA